MHYHDAVSRFRSFLEKKNYRLTKQRCSVLKQVMNTDGHFDIEAIIKAVKNNRLRASRATVYRTLEYIEECNLVQNIGTKDGRRFYERIAGTKPHEHMQCLKCGKTIEFCDAALENRVSTIMHMNGFKCANYSFQIFGICDDCKDRAYTHSAKNALVESGRSLV
jgi:Fur family ferric uptake transcriptional regulator